VIYSLHLLEEARISQLQPILTSLLKHEAVEVRSETVKTIQRLNLHMMLPEIKERIENESSATVLEAFLRTLGILAQGEVCSQISRFCDDPRAEVRRGSLIALMESCGSEGNAI